MYTILYFYFYVFIVINNILSLIYILLKRNRCVPRILARRWGQEDYCPPPLCTLLNREMLKLHNHSKILLFKRLRDFPDFEAIFENSGFKCYL